MDGWMEGWVHIDGRMMVMGVHLCAHGHMGKYMQM